MPREGGASSNLGNQACADCVILSAIRRLLDRPLEAGDDGGEWIVLLRRRCFYRRGHLRHAHGVRLLAVRELLLLEPRVDLLEPRVEREFLLARACASSAAFPCASCASICAFCAWNAISACVFICWCAASALIFSCSACALAAISAAWGRAACGIAAGRSFGSAGWPGQ